MSSGQMWELKTWANVACRKSRAARGWGPTFGKFPSQTAGEGKGVREGWRNGRRKWREPVHGIAEGRGGESSEGEVAELPSVAVGPCQARTMDTLTSKFPALFPGYRGVPTVYSTCALEVTSTTSANQDFKHPELRCSFREVLPQSVCTSACKVCELWSYQWRLSTMIRVCFK